MVIPRSFLLVLLLVAVRRFGLVLLVLVFLLLSFLPRSFRKLKRI